MSLQAGRIGDGFSVDLFSPLFLLDVAGSLVPLEELVEISLFALRHVEVELKIRLPRVVRPLYPRDSASRETDEKHLDKLFVAQALIEPKRRHVHYFRHAKTSL